MSELHADKPAKRERPGCVTVYAILAWLSGGIYAIGALCLGLSGVGLADGGLGSYEICLGGAMLLFAAVPIATGIGLWQMRKWGWALVVIVQGLAVILGLLSLGLSLLLLPSASSEFVAFNSSVLITSLANIAISGFIVYWFVKNRELFNGRTEYATVIGPDGETVYQPVEQKGSDVAVILATLVGLAMVLILVCIVVIALLAILGPQIGNVFSQITYELDQPAAGAIMRFR